jgi:hypothetical protein
VVPEHGDESAAVEKAKDMDKVANELGRLGLGF